MGVAVEVMKRKDPVAPAPAPAVAGEQPLTGVGIAVDLLDPVLDHDRQAAVGMLTMPEREPLLRSAAHHRDTRPAIAVVLASDCQRADRLSAAMSRAMRKRSPDEAATGPDHLGASAASAAHAGAPTWAAACMTTTSWRRSTIPQSWCGTRLPEHHLRTPWSPAAEDGEWVTVAEATHGEPGRGLNNSVWVAAGHPAVNWFSGLLTVLKPAT